jgi:phosphosulfolactate phosphohydrolase-like enzyme
MTKKDDLGAEIARVAYNLYERRGKLAGYALEDWLQAEKIVMERHIREIEKEPGALSSAMRKKTSGEKPAKKQKSEKKILDKPVKKVSKKTK